MKGENSKERGREKREGADPDEKTLRNFGLLVGGIFLLIGLWPLIKHTMAFFFGRSVIRLLFALAGGALLYFGWKRPSILKIPYRFWMKIGMGLGWLNTRILLGGIFFLLFTPIGIIARIFGYDPLKLGFDPGLASYREPVKIKKINHMENQF